MLDLRRLALSLEHDKNLSQETIQVAASITTTMPKGTTSRLVYGWSSCPARLISHQSKCTLLFHELLSPIDYVNVVEEFEGIPNALDGTTEATLPPWQHSNNRNVCREQFESGRRVPNELEVGLHHHSRLAHWHHRADHRRPDDLAVHAEGKPGIFSVRVMVNCLFDRVLLKTDRF